MHPNPAFREPDLDRLEALISEVGFGMVFLTTRTLGTFFSIQMGRPEIPTLYNIGAGLLSIPVSFLLTRSFGLLGAAMTLTLVALLRSGVAILLFVSSGAACHRKPARIAKRKIRRILCLLALCVCL